MGRIFEINFLECDLVSLTVVNNLRMEMRKFKTHQTALVTYFGPLKERKYLTNVFACLDIIII